MIHFPKYVQVQSLPWIVALLVQGDIQCNRDYQPSYINSQCSATLVSVSLSSSIFLVVVFQIGSNFAITAAHCVINSDTGKVRPATSLSVLPGMKDRSTPTLVARWGRGEGRGGNNLCSDMKWRWLRSWSMKIFALARRETTLP